MELGIGGKWAIVCASSKGLGFGCAKALALEGVNVVINSRSSESLAVAADSIRSISSSKVISVVGDVTTEEGRDRLLRECDSPDILVTNAGGPPPGLWSDWNRDDFIKAIDANMLTPISLIQSVLPKMIDQGWGRIVNITSQSVKAPIAVLGLSNSARAGLTGFVAGTSRQVAGTGVTINNLLPGIHATDRAVALDTVLRTHKTSALRRRNQEDAKRSLLEDMEQSMNLEQHAHFCVLSIQVLLLARTFC